MFNKQAGNKAGLLREVVSFYQFNSLWPLWKSCGSSYSKSSNHLYISHNVKGF